MALREPIDGRLILAKRDPPLTCVPRSVTAFASKITFLELSHNAIRTTENLEAFTNVTELILDDNQLTECSHLPASKTLKVLSLNKNQLTDLEGLLDVAGERFPQLTGLSLLYNPICPYFSDDEDDYRRYRLRIIYRLNRLKYLDSRPVLAAERNEAATRGHLYVVSKPIALSPPQAIDSELSAYDINSLKPLPPPTPIDPNEFPVLYAKQEFVYLGTKSEGNRFITNKDLDPTARPPTSGN